MHEPHRLLGTIPDAANIAACNWWHRGGWSIDDRSIWRAPIGTLFALWLTFVSTIQTAELSATSTKAVWPFRQSAGFIPNKLYICASNSSGPERGLSSSVRLFGLTPRAKPAYASPTSLRVPVVC